MSLDIGPFWELRRGAGPLIGVALHAGHNLRSEIVPLLAIDETARFREEDPYSDYWTLACDTQLLTLRSRFEVDLNRSREDAVYRAPEDAWGHRIWKEAPSEAVIAASLAEHDRFYHELEKDLRDIERREGRFVVLEFHSYNHRRGGPNAVAEDAARNPEVNIGTGAMDRSLWAPVVDRFMDELTGFDFLGRHLDVRENVKFRGRYLSHFVQERFPKSGCVLAIEVKKFFMDEWTGLADTRQISALMNGFRVAGKAVLEELDNL
jgi:hypothetical protein